MLLGFNHLRALAQSNNIVERLAESELSKEGGVAFDLRLGELHEFTGDGMLGVATRKTPETKQVGAFSPDQPSFVTLEPGKYYVAKTIERLNTPLDLAAVIIARSTVFRSGLLLLAGLVDPGYKGEITFGLINLSGRPFKVELGSRIANLVFLKVDGQAHSYKGHYQGGHHGTDKS